MYKKTIKSLFVMLISFVLCMTFSSASECTYIENEDDPNYSTVDQFNEGNENEHTIPSDQKMICKYNTYEDNSDHKAHIEIYFIGSDSSTQYFIYRVIEPKNGGSNKIRMMACYNPSFRGEQIVPVDTYDIWSNETPINGKSNANYFLGDFRTSCPAYAGVKTANFVEPETQETVTASTFYYGTQGSVAGDNVRVGTVSEVGDGYTKRIGFNPATVKSLAELYGKTKQKKTYVKNSEKYEKNLCNMPATLKTLRVLSYIIMIGRYVAVLLLMIFLTLDVYKCFINDGNFKKIQKSIIIRISCAVAIFFIPVIVNSFVHLVSTNEDSAFHNCSVCFFKDKFNSYNECEKKIEELGEDLENLKLNTSIAALMSDGSAFSIACFTLGESPLNIGPNLDKLGFTTVF